MTLRAGALTIKSSEVHVHSLPPSQGVAGAALHGKGAGGQGLFDQGHDLCAQAGFAVGEQAESFDRGATDDVRWIVVERHEQTGGAKSLCAGVSECGR